MTDNKKPKLEHDSESTSVLKEAPVRDKKKKKREETAVSNKTSSPELADGFPSESPQPVGLAESTSPPSVTAIDVTEHRVTTVPAPIRGNSVFTKEMINRAHDAGILPHELLYTVAYTDGLEFADYVFVKGQPIKFTRTATIAERIDCAKAAAPYYAAKKGENVKHEGEIRIIHALAESPLDAIEIDAEGNVIDGELADDDLDDIA
jgi:hypothetical protein